MVRGYSHGNGRMSLTIIPSLSVVLVDKPVTSTAEEAKELGELAKSKNLVLYPFQNRRWDSDFLALQRLLSEPPQAPQSLGDLVEFESQ
jgi:predicted dehydrogenase